MSRPLEPHRPVLVDGCSVVELGMEAVVEEVTETAGLVWRAKEYDTVIHVAVVVMEVGCSRLKLVRSVVAAWGSDSAAAAMANLRHLEAPTSWAIASPCSPRVVVAGGGSVGGCSVDGLVYLVVGEWMALAYQYQWLAPSAAFWILRLQTGGSRRFRQRSSPCALPVLASLAVYCHRPWKSSLRRSHQRRSQSGHRPLARGRRSGRCGGRP